MRILPCLFVSMVCCFQTSLALRAASSPDPAQTWNDLHRSREALKSFHQEFEVSRTFKTRQNVEASKSSMVVDGAAERWRESSRSGAGDRVTIFDGQSRFEFEAGGDEFVQLKPSAKEQRPEPGPYDPAHLDFSKVTERERRQCGLSHLDHECVTLDIPIKPWMRNGGTVKVMNGVTRVIFDTTSGLLVSSHTLQNIDSERGGYQAETTYLLKRMSFNGEIDESLFRAPSGSMKEVKELSAWNAARIKKQLAGKPAPDFALTDLQGHTIKLSDLKGRTILLDFWATWCGPCRADGPSLDKLYEKYGRKNLTIVGISVDEDKPVVQKFLTEHPHPYSIVLTTDNEMPRPYQIGVFPTYIVIDPDGNLASATDGDKGFSDLRRLLKKAGLDTD